MTFRSHNFWDFSVDLYARPKVAEACLDLQQSYQLDVNLLLFCYWHGHYHGLIDKVTLEQAIEFSGIWKHAVVQPLRNVRRWMKANKSPSAFEDEAQFQKLRSRVKFDELAAEKYQQDMLEQLALKYVDMASDPVGKDTIHGNIELLFAGIGLQMNDLIEAKLKLIAKAMVS